MYCTQMTLLNTESPCPFKHTSNHDILASYCTMFVIGVKTLMLSRCSINLFCTYLAHHELESVQFILLLLLTLLNLASNFRDTQWVPGN